MNFRAGTESGVPTRPMVRYRYLFYYLYHKNFAAFRLIHRHRLRFFLKRGATRTRRACDRTIDIA